MRNICSFGMVSRRRNAIRSAAELDGAHARILIFVSFLSNCLIASTIVIVFPVPGLNNPLVMSKTRKLNGYVRSKYDKRQ